jgi:hypothetical protein
LIGDLRSERYALQDEEKGFVFAFNDIELYDADGDAATRGDRVWADGNVSFEPVLELELEIDGFELKKLIFAIGADQTATIQLTAGREATFAESRTLDEIELTPITFSIGPVPVVLVPRIALLAGVDGLVTAELTAGVSEDITARVGFGYENGSWSPVAELDPNAQFDAPQFRDGAKGTARLWAGPRAELAAYGVAGVYGELRGFIRGEIDSTANPWWTLSAGIDARAGVFVEVLDDTVADYHTDPLEQSVSLGDAGGPAPSAGEGVVTWARSFGGAENDNNDSALAVIGTPEGGVLVVGASNSFTASSTDVWVLKLDRLGQVSWQVGFEGARVGIDATMTKDGGYLVLAGAPATGADSTRLIRLDHNGDPLWGTELAADKPLSGHTLVPLGEDYVVGGIYGSGVEADFWLAAVDDSGAVKWSTALGGEQGDELYGLTATPEGSLVAVGPTHSFDVSFFGHWAVKLDGGGNALWQYAFDGGSNEWITDVFVDTAGDYRLIGRLNYDALVTRLGSDGTLKSAVAYDAGPYDEAFAGVATPDGGLLVAGNTGLGDQADLWLLRVTPDEEVQWTTSYGGPRREEVGGTIQYAWVSTPLAPSDDGGFVVLSNSASFSDSFSDIWINKVSGTGGITYQPGNGVMRTSLAGTFEDYALTRSATNAVAVDVPLTATPLELRPYTPNAKIQLQAVP